MTHLVVDTKLAQHGAMRVFVARPSWVSFTISLTALRHGFIFGWATEAHVKRSKLLFNSIGPTDAAKE